MDWKKYGYVLSSKYRQKVVLSIKEGPKTPKQISKESNLHLSHVSSTLKQLVKNNIIKCLTPELKKGKIYELTTGGREIADKIG